MVYAKAASQRSVVSVDIIAKTNPRMVDGGFRNSAVY